MYHSISAILHPLHLNNTPSANSLKSALIKYYSQTGKVRKIMEKTLPINFKERLADIRRPDRCFFILVTILE